MTLYLEKKSNNDNRKKKKALREGEKITVWRFVDQQSSKFSYTAAALWHFALPITLTALFQTMKIISLKLYFVVDLIFLDLPGLGIGRKHR